MSIRIFKITLVHLIFIKDEDTKGDAVVKSLGYLENEYDYPSCSTNKIRRSNCCRINADKKEMNGAE